MALGGFTLADRLGAKTHPCRVVGCTRSWIELPGKALKLGKSGSPAESHDATAGLCDPCRAKLATLADKQRRCDTPGCHGTWTWTVASQLEAFAAHRQPPRGVCGPCEAKLASLEDKEVPCGIPGCARTGTLTKRAQLLALNEPAAEPTPDANGASAAPAAEPTSDANGASAAPEAAPPMEGAQAAEGAGAPAEGETAEKGAAAKGARPTKETPKEKGSRGKVTFKGPFCAPCADVAKRLQDRPVSCGIASCKRKWIWKADEQIQAFAAGKPNEPPRRMCEECRANFGKLTDRQVRCRTSGCKKTWTWSRSDQLDACVADKPPPKAPSRMCESCYTTFSGLKDVERPCRKGGCKRTWTDKRGAQLARLVRGKTGDPYPQYCSEHQKELGELEDREVACKTEGCPGTWTWSREQQLAAGVRPVPKHEPGPGGRPASPPEASSPGEPARPAPTPATNGEAGGNGEAAVALADPGRDGSTQPGTDEAGTDEAGAAEAGAAETGAVETGTIETAGLEADADAGTAGDDEPAASEAVVSAEGAPSAAAPAARGEKKKRKRNRRRHRQPQPPERLCGACAEFLKDKKTLEIPCSQCGTAIYWPPESQLQTHLGNWAAPTMCGACKRDATEKAREAAREALRHPGEEAPAPAAASTDGEASASDASAPDASAPDAGQPS